jgi:uncharacterized membrane protein YozB (DUF420 family)
MPAAAPLERGAPNHRIAGILFVGALMTSAWAWWLIAWPVITQEAAPRHVGHFAAVFTHMLGGTVMLALGAAALFVGWTRRHFRYHKGFGYAYLAAGVVGSVIAFVLAVAPGHRNPEASLAARLADANDTGIALATLSVAWVAVSAMAFRAAKNRRFDTHRAWMIRSYVLTWTFVLCRLLGRVPALESLGDGAAIVWLSWIVPLLVCEIALQWSATSPRPIAIEEADPAHPLGPPLRAPN